MKIKKLFGLGLAMLGVVSLASCIGSHPKDQDPTDNPNHQETPENPGTTNPENPGSTTPENPGTTNPENPGSTTPENPGSTTPENPGPTNPENPEIKPDKPSEGLDDNLKEDEIIKSGEVVLTNYSGLSEAGYVEFAKVSGATSYNVYLKGETDSDYKLLDEKMVYVRELSSTKMRADILGLKAGSYNVKINFVVNSTEAAEAKASICNLNVIAYDRSGYAHFNYSDGVGAYKDDGTLKDNAIVLYVTDETKNTVTLEYKGKTITGIGNILNSSGQKCGDAGHENDCKRVSKGKTYYGKGNENDGILKTLADDNIPLVVRFIGCVSDSGLYERKTFDASKASLIEGLTAYSTKSQNLNDYGAIPGDNGHMARMKSAKDVTLEGVGEDAVIDGWGFHFICETANPNLGKSFETRNLAFINTPEDALGMEGVQANGAITAGVERCWIHNNEFYGPDISSPAESDKSEGDGSCDFKRGQYFTCSYNYFEGCHKTNLVGSADDSLQYNLTYHHNYWKLCKARGPLARNSNIHMYNNVFDGQTDYAMNTRANAFIYSEYNLFYMCKSPQRVDSGAIKSYNDSFSSCINLMDGTIVNDRTTPVANNCKYGSIDYSKFELNEKQSYIPTGDYILQTSVTDARKVIEAKSGVSKGYNVSPKDVTLEQLSYLPANAKPVVVSTYPTTLNPGKVSKTVYAFKLEKSATVTITYADENKAPGILVNLAGEAFVSGNGTAILEAGTYIIQAMNIQPGDSKAVTVGTFKDMTIDSIKIEEYKSDEFDKQLIDNYNERANSIPAEISFNDACYQAIVAAKNAYAALSSELKEKVSVPYTKVTQAWAEYIALGKTNVENLISNIGTVTKDSGSAISIARAAYTRLVKLDSSVQISNYQVLLDAELAFKDFAIQSCIDKINAIGTVTLASKDAIELARAEYDALDDEEQKTEITNYDVLVAAEKAYNSLKAVDDVDSLIDDADTASISSMKAVMDAYNALTSAQQAQITNKEKLSLIKVNYTIDLIEAIGTVTSSSGNAIKEAEDLYASLDAEQQASVTNYATLQSARTAYDKILAETIKCTFNGSPSNAMFTVSGKYGETSATINGTSYTKGLKMESSTTVTFTTTTVRTLTLHVTGGKKIKVDGTSYDVPSTGVLVISNLVAGEHTISKDTTSTLLYEIILG